MSRQLKISNPIAKRALAIGKTRSGGDVEGALSSYLKTPAGGWPETEQAYDQLFDAVYAAANTALVGDCTAGVAALIDAAVNAGWACHPMRRAA